MKRETLRAKLGELDELVGKIRPSHFAPPGSAENLTAVRRLRSIRHDLKLLDALLTITEQKDPAE